MNQTHKPDLFNPPVSEIKKESWWQVFIVLAIATAILFVRKTDAFVYPQFWAEDGSVFFQDQVNQGWVALIKPYAGYLHLVPRLIALITDAFFPYSAAPMIYNYLSLLVVFIVILNIYSARLIMDNKALLALSIVLVPHFSNEVFMNATNTNWILAILLLVVLLKETPDKRFGKVAWQIIADLVAMVCCGVSGPAIVFLAPFFIWRFFIRKSRYDLCLAVMAGLMAAIQAYFILRETLVNNVGQTSAPLIDYWCVAGQRLFGNLFLGSSLPFYLNPYLLCWCGVLVLASVICLGIKRGKMRQLFIFLTFAGMVMLTTFLKFKAFLEVLLPPENGARYFYLPYVMFTWALILCLNQAKKSENRLVSFLLAAILFSSLTSEFHSPPFQDFHWSQYSRLILKNQNMIIPINPPGWWLAVAPGK